MRAFYFPLPSLTFYQPVFRRMAQTAALEVELLVVQGVA